VRLRRTAGVDQQDLELAAAVMADDALDAALDGGQVLIGLDQHDDAQVAAMRLAAAIWLGARRRDSCAERVGWTLLGRLTEVEAEQPIEVAREHGLFARRQAGGLATHERPRQRQTARQPKVIGGSTPEPLAQRLGLVAQRSQGDTLLQRRIRRAPPRHVQSQTT
jgi:hypothetical protein